MSDIKKVQKKLRDSEAARVKAVRRAEASEFNFGQNVKELRTAESEIKKLKEAVETRDATIRELDRVVDNLKEARAKL